MVIDKKFHIWGGILLISILFFPNIDFGNSLPTFQIADLTLPITALLIIFKRDQLKLYKYYWIILIFCAYIPITMAINGRLNVVNDYFEIYRFLKFMLLIMFFSLLDATAFARMWFKPLFILLVIANMFHFYNIFGFHDLLVKVFGGEHLEYFGLNSLKEPATKRMMGMASNPNINAVIFGFYTVYFLPLKFNRQKMIWFIVACLMLFLCQSRTSIVALAFVFTLIALFRLSNWNWKNWLIIGSSVIGIYLLSWCLTTDFFTYNSYSNNVGASGSAMSRLETFRFLGGMIIEKPFFGHGVNKNFFYDNHLYSENEYILMMWRYGVVGLVLYLLLFLIPIRNYFRDRHQSILSNSGILFLAIIMITALTNNPFLDRTVMMLIALVIGLISPFQPTKDALKNEE